MDVLVDTGAQVSLVRRGLFKEELLQPSRRPVRLKVANGEIMGGGTHEATISMEFWEHERLNRPKLWVPSPEETAEFSSRSMEWRHRCMAG